MATISTVAVDFVANTAKYTQGLTGMQKQTKAWSAGIKKDTQGATDAFDGVSKALNRFATQAVSIVAIQKIGAAFVNAAKDASKLVDEAEKIGASAGELATLEMAAQKSGVSIDAIRTSFRELQKSVNEALNGTDATAQAFLDLGISYTELSKKDPTDRFYAIVDALKEVKDANKRAELGTLLLGKAYQEVTPLINKGSGGIKAAGAGALGTDQLLQIDKVTKAFEEVGRVLDLQIKKILIEIAPLLIDIAKAATYVLQNLKSVAVIAAIAFSPIGLYKFANAIKSIAIEVKDYGSYLKGFGAGAKGLVEAGLMSVEQYAKQTKTAEAAANVAKALTFVSTAALVAAKSIGFLIAASAGFAAASYGFEAYAQKIGNSSAAADLRESRTALSDFAIEVTRFFGFTFAGKTSTEKLADDFSYASKKLADAKKNFVEVTNAKKLADAQIAKDQDLVNFRQTLDSIIKLPLVERFTELTELNRRYNGSLDPKKQEELNKALRAMDQEMKNLSVSTVENIDAGAKRYKQTQEINLLVSKQFLTEAQGRIAKNKLLRQEAGQYDEIIKLQQDVMDITSNSMLLDKDKEYRIKSLGQSYIDLIDPISKFDRELKKVNASETFKIITPEQRAALTDYYNLQLKSTQVGLTGNDKLSAEQKYLETLQQINQYLPAQSQQIDIITMRTIALKNAEMQRFIEITPYFKEIAGFGQNFADGLANAIVEGQNFGDALKNVFQDILKQIAVLIIRTTILQTIMGAIGFVSGPASAAFGKLTGLPASIPSGGDLATGGPVSFGKSYRVGEAGPETFVPQMNGYILPNDMRSDGGGVTINQTNNFQSGVSRAEIYGLIPKIKAETMLAISDSRARGGSFSRSITA